MSEENGNGAVATVYQAEQDFVTCLLGVPERVCEVSDQVRPEYLADQTFRLIYSAMVALDRAREHVDSTSIATATDNRVSLAWLRMHESSAPNPAFLGHYARRVCTIATNRDLGRILGEIAATALLEPLNEAHLERAEQALYEIANRSKPVTVRHITEPIERIEARIDAGHIDHQTKTGFDDLDDLLGGFAPGELIVVGARPGMGKSALAACMCLDIARHQQPVVVFQIEMGDEVMAERIAAANGRFNLKALHQNRLGGDYDEARRSLTEVKGMPIYIDPSYISVAGMRGVVRRLSHRQTIAAIFVDYLQLVKPTEGDNRTEKVGGISRGLKLLAREFMVPVIALAQVGRGADRNAGPPTLSDLRESGSIEADADVVLFVHRPHKDDPPSQYMEKCELVCAKNRNGPVRKIELLFNRESARFESPTQGEPVP